MPPGDVQLLKELAADGDQGEDDDKQADAAIGQNRYNGGDHQTADQLLGSLAVNVVDHAQHGVGDGVGRSGIAHELSKDGTKQKDHKIIFRSL